MPRGVDRAMFRATAFKPGPDRDKRVVYPISGSPLPLHGDPAKAQTRA